jgi:hypothetical protein
MAWHVDRSSFEFLRSYAYMHAHRDTNRSVGAYIDVDRYIY